jgi:enoyl-CoA hydratase
VTTTASTGAVIVERPRSQILQLTLNRPARRNAMNVDLLGGLYDAFETARVDREARVIVLTGAGPGFCAGLDLAEGVALDTAGLGRARAGMKVQQYIADLIR